MGHDHPHTHHASNESARRAVGFAALLTAAFMVVEAVGGLLSGSLALLADAGHMLTDSAALTLAWFAFAMARRQPDARRSYGYARYEVLAATANGAVLIGIAIWIVAEAIERLGEPMRVLPLPMLWIATGGLIVNLIVFRILHADSDQLNVRAAMLHVLGDLLGSVATIIAGGVILFTGWHGIDPLLSILIALLIGASAVALLRETLHILLQGTPPHLDPRSISSALSERLPGVRDVHQLHVWSLSQDNLIATLHLRLEPDADTQTVLAAAKDVLRSAFGVGHSTIQICGDQCPDDVSRPPS